MKRNVRQQKFFNKDLTWLKKRSNLSSNIDFFSFFFFRGEGAVGGHLAKLLASPGDCSVYTIALIFEDRITETEFNSKKTKPLSKLHVPQMFKGMDAEVVRQARTFYSAAATNTTTALWHSISLPPAKTKRLLTTHFVAQSSNEHRHRYFFLQVGWELKSCIEYKNRLKTFKPLSICSERRSGIHPPDLTGCTESWLILSGFFQMSDYLKDFND